MRPRTADAILDHLTRRKVLSPAEERWLDRDGDGRLTTRDLLIARAGRQLPLLPEIVPETRHVRPGETLKCTALGVCPPKLSAVMNAGAKSIDLAISSRRFKKRTRIEIELPGTADLGKKEARLTIWICAANVIPRAVSVTLGGSHEQT